MKPLNFLSSLLFLRLLTAQTPYPDTVNSVNYGPGAGYGQAFFPDNVLGFPAPDATFFAPAYQEEDILTLGTAGSITLEFTDNEIFDGPGPDFTIFENVFYFAGDTSKPFRETAFVEVSPDGFEWQIFPVDTLTGKGLAGLRPTNGSANPLNPDSSGGDAFDLADLPNAPEVIHFIRLTDAGDLFPDDGSSFDLDAVVGLNSRAVSHIEKQYYPNESVLVENFPNPFNSRTIIRIHSNATFTADISLFNSQGKRIRSVYENHLFRGGTSLLHLEMNRSIAGGIYFLSITSRRFTVVKKLIFLP
jgi:hypothetical protein